MLQDPYIKSNIPEAGKEGIRLRLHKDDRHAMTRQDGAFLARLLGSGRGRFPTLEG